MNVQYMLKSIQVIPKDMQGMWCVGSCDSHIMGVWGHVMYSHIMGGCITAPVGYFR